MAGQILPVFGGALVPDTGGEGDQGGGVAQLPPGLLDILLKFGQKGIVVSGVITWVSAQIDTQTNDSWKTLAERCFKDSEISEGKEALKVKRQEALLVIETEYRAALFFVWYLAGF